MSDRTGMLHPLLLMVFVTAPVVAQADESAKSLVDDCCRYRGRIKSVHLKIADTRPADRPQRELPLKLEVWCDVVNDVYRCDRLEPGQDAAREIRSVSGWQCQFKDCFLSYYEREDPNAQVASFSRQSSGHHLIPRMQLLGILPTGIKDLGDPPFGLQECKWLRDLRNGLVKPLPADLITAMSKFEDLGDRINDLRLIVFAQKMKMLQGKDGPSHDQLMTCRAVFDTQKGNQIIYAERRFAGADYSMVDSTNVSLKQWDGIWFPQRIVNESLDGKELAEREELTVSDVQLNSDQPFGTLTAIKIAPGSIVTGVPGKKAPLRWDGKKLVPANFDP